MKMGFQRSFEKMKRHKKGRREKGLKFNFNKEIFLLIKEEKTF